jgi:hypothetical protein
MAPAFRSLSIAATVALVAAVAVPLVGASAVGEPGSIVSLDRSGSGIPTDRNVAQIAVGLSHGLALLDDGSVTAWGSNASGETTVPSFGDHDVEQVAAGADFSAALLDDGTISAWGTTSLQRTNVAAINAATSDVVQIAANALAGLALLENGDIMGWGEDDAAQLVPGAALITANHTVTSIAKASIWAVAITDDEDIIAWGHSNETPVINAVNTAPDKNYTKVAVSDHAALALTDDGEVIGLGSNSNGVVAGAAAATEGQVITDIAMTGATGYALTQQGTVIVWGTDTLGYIADGPNEDFTSLVSGTYGSYAVRGVASATFTYGQAPLEGATLPLGATFMVDATRLTSGDEYTIDIDGTTVLESYVDGDREISREVTLPSTLSGPSHEVTLTVGDDEFSASFTLNQAVGLPVVTGTAQVGQELTSTLVWPGDTTVKHQWYRSGKAITTAKSSGYTIVAADLGKKLTVTITGTKANTVTKRSSVATAAVIAGVQSTGVTAVNGDAAVGSTLTAVDYNYSAGARITHQWMVNGKAVAGATKATFVPTAAQIFGFVSIRTGSTLAGYGAYQVQSMPNARVDAGEIPFGQVEIIGGQAQVGKTLAAKPTGFTSGVTMGYQWMANSVSIPGANSATYTPTAAQKGKNVTLLFYGSKPGFVGVNGQAENSFTVLGTLTAPTPKITGTLKVGKTLTAVTGTWPAGSELSYEWRRGAVSVGTDATYLLTSADKGKTLTVRVTGTSEGYAPLTKASAVTKKIS